MNGCGEYLRTLLHIMVYCSGYMLEEGGGVPKRTKLNRNSAVLWKMCGRGEVGNSKNLYTLVLTCNHFKRHCKSTGIHAYW